MLVPAARAAAVILLADLAARTRRAKPELVEGVDASAVAAVIRRCGGEQGFWPTPWLGGFLGGHLQTIWYGLKLDEPPLGNVVEETWQAPDGGTIGLAWPEGVPVRPLPTSAPVVLILPGLCGSIQGTGHSVNAMLSSGCRPVVLHARGCGQPLTSPCFNLFGNTDDVRSALKRIASTWPGAPIGLYGISAGTALLVRYLGEEGGALLADSTPRVVAGVANCPGYDIGVCLTRCGWLYDGGFYIRVLKRHWLEGENGRVLRAHDAEACRRMAAAPDMHSFMIEASPFSSPSTASGQIVADAFADFLARSNPMGVAHRIEVPIVILNADDDPVCARRNTDESAGSLVRGMRRAVLLRLPAGGHCTFAEGLSARRWGDALAANFLREVGSGERVRR
jgi:uncharacterized protein